MNVGEIFIALGFDVDDGKLKDFQEKVQGLNKDLIKASAVAAGAVFSLMAFVDGSVRGARALKNFQDQTGSSARELQKWQIAARLSDIGMSADETQSSLMSLSKSLADITMGGGDAGAFGMFGVDIDGKDAFDVLEDLRGMLDTNIARFGEQQTVGLLQRMGLDPRFISLLKTSSEEMERYRKELTLSEKSQMRLLELGKAVEFFKAKLGFMKDQFVSIISPQVIEFFKNILIVIEQFIGWLDKMTQGFKNLKQAHPYMTAFFSVLYGWLILVLVPFGKLVLFPALLLAAFNDLGAYLRGEDSWIGWLIKKMEELDRWLGEIPKKIKDMFDLSGQFSDKPVSKLKFGENFWNVTFPDNVASGAGGKSETKETNFNNTYNINGTAPAADVAAEITKRQQDQFNYSLTDANSGSVY